MYFLFLADRQRTQAEQQGVEDFHANRVREAEKRKVPHSDRLQQDYLVRVGVHLGATADPRDGSFCFVCLAMLGVE